MAEPRSTPQVSSSQGPEAERLESWKEIAVYLRREVRTVQRWEKREGLPVHRHTHSERASVYAYKSELDAWWENRRSRLEAEEGSKAAATRWVRWLPVPVTAVLLLAAVGMLWRNRSPQFEPAPVSEGDPNVVLPDRIFAAEARQGSPVPALDVEFIWLPLVPAGQSPAPRSGVKATFDAASRRMTIFGGYYTDFLNDTWVLANVGEPKAGPQWLKLAPEGKHPPARMNHSSVYDPRSNRMIVFAGQDANQCFNDVWILTNANGIGGPARWLALRPKGTLPETRAGHAAAYDSRNNRMIVYGGISSSPGRFLSGVWVLENANGLGGTPRWRQLAPLGTGPGARRDHAAAYDPASDRLIVVGGFTTPPGSPAPPNDVWLLENALVPGRTPRWILLRTQGMPPSPRAQHTAVYDAQRNRLIVGFGSGPLRNLDDVWVLSNANGLGETSAWSMWNLPDPRPGRRSLPAMVLDSESGRLVVYAGHVGGGATALSDVWMLAGAQNVAEEFSEGFESTTLDPAWQVLAGVGRFSLTESPGQLRYRSLPPGSPKPRLTLLRQFRGEHWILEVKSSHFMGPSGGGRSFRLSVGFGAVPGDRDAMMPNQAILTRRRDDWAGQKPGTYDVEFWENGKPLFINAEVPPHSTDTLIWRIARQGRSVAVQASHDGAKFQDVVRHTFGAQIDGVTQFLVVAGDSFANFDSYADFDYIRLKRTPTTSPLASSTLR